jgi:uncharacterized protein YhaN
MKITEIKIDGFGVWRDLSLRGLSSELTVFYGPNEAGKSTLMQFMRSVLYGVSPARREKYLPPVVGGRPGGWLKVTGDDGALTISRYADRGPTDVGKVTVTTPDGHEQGDRLLRESLEHVDEPTYNNIFAVGLREVQELNTLSDTAAAQWLYRLTSGLDRISLYDVIHMLAGTQLRLLNSAEGKSEIRALLSRKEQLEGELEELITKGRRWAQSAVKLRELAEDVERRQAEVKSLAARGRRLEVAINIKPLWIKRIRIDDQLERFAGLRPLEEGTIESLDELNTRIEDHERQRDILRGQRQQLRDEGKRLGINDLLIRNGQRLEALLEQQDWLQALERAATELADEVKQLEARLTSENERLSHEWTGAGKLPPRITSDVVETLTPQIRAIEATEQLLDTARHELEIHRAGESQYRAEIESAMTSGDKLGLPKDLDAAGDLVAQLRRRQVVENRIESARRQADDLQEQAQSLVDEQVVPMGLFSWLLAVFVVGFVALGVWFVMPSASLGRYGGWIAAIGIGGSVVAWLIKHFAEDSARDRFDNCHRQIEMLADQMDEAEEERAQLDRDLPLAYGSVALRLQYAEKHLAELERVLPVEGQRRELEQEIDSAERRVKLAEEKHASALSNWKARLRALGLPDDISPASLSTMAGQCERLNELEARIENRRDDMQRRGREYNVVSQRIFALAEETALRLGDPAVTDLSEAGREVNKKKQGSHTSATERTADRPGAQNPTTVRPLEQLDHLRAEYHKHLQRVEQRKSLRERSKALRVEEAKHARGAIGTKRRRIALFQKCGVADEQELRQLAAKLDEAADLRKKRETVTREIAAAIGKHGTEADFATLLAADVIGRLEHDFESLSSQLEQLDRELKEALQRRGAMVEQQRAAAADHSLAEKQIELDMVEQQIQRAADAWRERAAVSMFLERVRVEYEQHRQPETLREASEYMKKLTGGKYTRIWTPLAHDILFVDQADGQPLSVQVLSRGTREQLFVSLRLALVSAYARRGIHLPMILDDVFVNFDAGRTRTACAVLKDFAKQGHQLLVFTCHEHVWRMFQELKVDTRRIPNRHGDVEEEIVEPQPEPVAALPEPVVVVEPEPVPEPPKVVEVVPEPVVIEAPPVVVVERVVEVPEPEPAPVANLAEVEYWWDTTRTPLHPVERESEEVDVTDWADSTLHTPGCWGGCIPPTLLSGSLSRAEPLD